MPKNFLPGAAVPPAASPGATPREARFWNRIARRYARKPVADLAAYERKLAMTRACLTAEMTVYEFGCGTGSTALAHAAHVRRIEATDISAEMIAIAREKAATAGVNNVSFRQAVAMDVAAPADGFDAVLGMSILHLLPSWRETIAEAYRMLKPGGVFVSSTACLSDMSPVFRLVLPVARWFGLVPFVAFFDRQALEHTLTAAGFTIEENWQPGRGKAVFIIARKPG